ncbi:MAG: hypothetical protein ACREGB_02015 [Candidatus Saccharimonadales bacterium]
MKLKQKIPIAVVALLTLLSPLAGLLSPSLGAGQAAATGADQYSFTSSGGGNTIQLNLPSDPGATSQFLGSTAADNGLNDIKSLACYNITTSCYLSYHFDYASKSGSTYTFKAVTHDGLPPDLTPGLTPKQQDPNAPPCTTDACDNLRVPPGYNESVWEAGSDCASITVDEKSPGKGTVHNCGDPGYQVALGDSDILASLIKNGGPTKSTPTITVNGILNLNFGQVDSGRALSGMIGDLVSFDVKCADAKDTTCNSVGNGADADPSGLTTDPHYTGLLETPVVTYSATVQTLLPTKQYIACFSSDLIDHSEGSTPNTVCSKPFTTKAKGTTTVTMSANGLIDKLPLISDHPDYEGFSCVDNTPGTGWLLCKLISGMQAAVGGIYDHIINPLLTVEPIVRGSPIYSAWSNFRIYGDILLFIALLVIVFGESIGGGIIDAYSAKKILPRLLIAALLINISYYLVAIAVDITNIIGNGLADLITAPFALTGDFNLQVGTVGDVGMTSLMAGAVVWHKISFLSFDIGHMVAWLWFGILLPVLLLFLSILVVILLRQALIVFLVIISPIAFALYCLPNTEKYFQKWWEVLFETLLIFPIVTVMFAMGKVSAVLMMNLSKGGILDGLADILGVIALAVPLVLIPFSFKLAGGIIGRAHDLVSGGRQKLGLGQASRDRIRAQHARNRLQSRQSLYNSMQNQASKGGRFRRATLGRALKGGSGLLGYNVDAEAAAAAAEVGKTVDNQINYGKDDEVRGLTVNKKWALKHGVEGQDWRMEGGSRQFRSLGGEWIGEADVDRGHARWGNDAYAQRAALSYEMRKADTEEKSQRLMQRYNQLSASTRSDGGWGMTSSQSKDAWKAAARQNEKEHVEYKHMDAETGAVSGSALATEMYEKLGSYQVGQMGSNTIVQLSRAYDEAVSSGDTATRDKISAISESFMHDTQSGGRQANTPGASHVAERVVELASKTRRFQPSPPGKSQK